MTVLEVASAHTDPAALSELSARAASTAPLRHCDELGQLGLPRRGLLALAAIAASSLASGDRFARADDPAAELPAATSAPGPATLSEYSNTQQRYRLMVPAAWDVKGKAGADVLFEDPARRSTSVGVTVNPVKVSSIEQFGGLDDVGAKLLNAERSKESTLDVSLVSSATRTGATGATLYEYEYELDSTRGRKRILNTVTIFNSKLYILNAAFKCEKDSCGGAEVQAGVALLRKVAGTFDVLA
ncbi:hypothetical protein HYH03_000137 [Edaphochlamys debaryana]|uniref:PsbP C-terminal domain-containing protein n=1 Tax=Edaphochlamys debaryana TaxID=47281 RepID=A0A835YEX2_9CHLO|nr:hypothetical protein HYH03_000137 [Edaphochlamys debaryana]|eukprot:KAG2501632.1 hypothetical protein HYH03_000137 [Edaphochlamys debaryana]